MSESMHTRITKLAGSKRTRPNLEKIQELVSDLDPAVDKAIEVTEALSPLYQLLEDLDGFEAVLAEAAADFELLDPRKVASIVAALRGIEKLVPDQMDEQSIHGLNDAVRGVEGTADEYESSLEDSDLSAEDREGVWENLTEALTALSYIYEES